MKVRIRERGVSVTERLRVHIDRRLGFALSRFGERITRVTVNFSDGKGARSSETLCRIEVTLASRKVQVEDTNDDAFAAVEHAAGRAARSVARVLAQELEPSLLR
jgi:ribosomal subunit interface protein